MKQQIQDYAVAAMPQKSKKDILFLKYQILY